MHMKVDGAFVWHLQSNSSASVGPVPRSRSKHAACLYDGHAYIYGGKDGNVPLKDLLRFNLRFGTWECLKWTGDIPPNLQEHSMVPYQNKIYIFGGNFQFGADPEIPFWVLDVGTMVSRKLDGVAPFPEGRRGHTAAIYKNTMYIFAGYIDMRRSSNELWAFSFTSERWRLLKAADGSGPSGRYSHSAVVHGHFMWIYGGLANLQTMSDLWFWDFSIERWTQVRTTQGPPSLEGHSACVLNDLMLIYGGSHDGILQNDLWGFNMVLNVWMKIGCKGPEPNPCSKHTTFLAVHNDWCSRPHCIDSASSLQRAASCPLSSHSAAQCGTRLSSNSARLARESASSKSNFRSVEMDALKSSGVSSRKKVLLSVNGSNAETINKSSVSHPPADIFYPRSGKSDGVCLLDDADSNFSPSRGITNQAAAELTGIQVPIDEVELGYENHNFWDSSHDLVISAAGSSRVNNSKESFYHPTSTSEVPDKTDTETSSADKGPKKSQHVLAVSLLGTPTKSQCSADQPYDRGRCQSLVQHEESFWVEMVMFGLKVTENGSSSQDMLIIQDVDDIDAAEPRENPSFNEHYKDFLNRRKETKKESCISDSEHDSRLLCGSGHYGIGDSRNVKEAWVSPAHKIKTDGVQRNDAETAMTEERVQSDGNQIPLSLEKRPVCQAELFQAKSTKLSPLPHPCPEYCMFVFGGRSSVRNPNLDIRYMPVSRLEVTFGNI